MKNRNLFVLLVVLVVLAPGIHYFIGGADQEQTTVRNILVGLQIVGGIVLLLLYGRKPSGE